MPGNKWLCVNGDIDLWDMTSSQGHGTPKGLLGAFVQILMEINPWMAELVEENTICIYPLTLGRDHDTIISY